MGHNFKQHIPWQVKIGAKIILSRLPMSYAFWEKLSLFKHGAMEQPDYAFNVLYRHYSEVEFSRKSAGFVGLELGPGDSLNSALIAKSLRASKVYLVDVGAFARSDLASFQWMTSYLAEHGYDVEAFRHCQSADDFLKASSAEYLTAGLNSLKTLATGSVDFIWSQAVLEHIRRDQFLPIFQELRRIQRRDGVGSHRVDLRDHLGGALNNLRFKESTWESAFMSSSGFYTNRIRFTEMLTLFRHAGFEVEVAKIERWAHVPTSRRKMIPPFRNLPDEELTVSGFDVFLH
jgi:SAM-dependent methyltransferase